MSGVFRTLHCQTLLGLSTFSPLFLHIVFAPAHSSQLFSGSMAQAYHLILREARVVKWKWQATPREGVCTHPRPPRLSFLGRGSSPPLRSTTKRDILWWPVEVWVMVVQRAERDPSSFSTRSPSSALLAVFVWEGSPTRLDYRKRVTLF